MQDIVVGYEGERPSSPMVPVISRRPNRIIGSRVAALDETVMVDQHIGAGSGLRAWSTSTILRDWAILCPSVWLRPGRVK